MERAVTKSPRETERFAKALLKKLLHLARQKQPLVVGFSGELGAGKTTLIQGLGKLLGIKEKIQSPTFVIIKKYKIGKKNLPWGVFVHIDAYRIEKRKEIPHLGLKNTFRDPRNLVVIEWPERIKNTLTPKMIWIELKHRGGNHRHIIIKSKI